jgi:hypothetical protein
MSTITAGRAAASLRLRLRRAGIKYECEKMGTGYMTRIGSRMIIFNNDTMAEFFKREEGGRWALYNHRDIDIQEADDWITGKVGR